MKKALLTLLIIFGAALLLWGGYHLEKNERLKNNRRAQIIEFYKELGREEIRSEAVDLKFALVVGNEFRWNTNVADLVERSYKAQSDAIEINKQTKDLMAVSIKSIDATARLGELIKTLNGDKEDGKAKGKQKQEEEKGSNQGEEESTPAQEVQESTQVEEE